MSLRAFARYIKYMFVIRRWEFFAAEIPIVLIPAVLAMPRADYLHSRDFWECALALVCLFNVGDMVNCLADRDVDARYKTHLAEAVDGLGRVSIMIQVAISVAVALGLAVHLSLVGRWSVLFLVVAGMTLGVAYSAAPFRIKSRGVAQLACQWAILFFGPALLVVAVSGTPAPALPLGVAALFGTIQTGIIMVNVAEDYPEDIESGVRTAVVALGIPGGMKLAARMVTAGGFALMLLIEFRPAGWVGWWLRLPFPLVWWLASRWLQKLADRVARADTDAACGDIKVSARLVPVWVTSIAWTVLVACWPVS